MLVNDIAAVPTDVRKVFDLPQVACLLSGLRPCFTGAKDNGEAPLLIV